MIKYAEIYKVKIENEIRYIAKVYIDREEIENESFSSPTFEETAKHILKDCVVSNYFDMTEGGIMKIKKYFYNAKDIMKILEVSLSQAYKVIRELNEELKQKGIRVQRGKVAIEYFNERYKIA